MHGKVSSRRGWHRLPACMRPETARMAASFCCLAPYRCHRLAGSTRIHSPAANDCCAVLVLLLQAPWPGSSRCAASRSCPRMRSWGRRSPHSRPRLLQRWLMSLLLQQRRQQGVVEGQRLRQLPQEQARRPQLTWQQQQCGWQQQKRWQQQQHQGARHQQWRPPQWWTPCSLFASAANSPQTLALSSPGASSLMRPTARS